MNSKRRFHKNKIIHVAPQSVYFMLNKVYSMCITWSVFPNSKALKIIDQLFQLLDERLLPVLWTSG